MKPFTFVNLTFVTIALATSAAPANAQGATVTAAPHSTVSGGVEVTPFFSIDSRGSAPVGAAISFPLGSTFRIEAEFGYRQGEGNLHAPSSSANLLYALPRFGRTTPYLATGAGLALYGAPIVSPGGSPVGTEPRIAFEVNAGGGVKVPVTEAWQMRSDARWFKSFGRNASEHWRVSHGLSFDVGQR
jgi:hypothetical protein